METIVLDTNVVVSALIGKGNPRRILELVFRGDAKMILSTSIMTEYARVLQRPKFSRYSDFSTEALGVLRLLKSIATFKEPSLRLDVCVDPDDNKFLELAVSAKVNYLITGNKKHFSSREYKNVQVVSPSEYLKLRRAK